MELFKPFWLIEYPGKTIEQRKKASKKIHECCNKIAELNDQQKLIEIARTAVYSSYRHEAEKKIEDQTVLRELAQKYHDEEAIIRLTDSEDILKEVVLTDTLDSIVDTAIRKIYDDTFLKSALEKAVQYQLPCQEEDKRRNSTSYIILTLASQISDQEYLFKLASGQMDFEHFYTKAQIAALNNLDDEEKLFSLVKSYSTNDDVAIAAIKKMRSAEHLEWIRDNMNTKGVFPTRGMIAADRLKSLEKNR